MPKHYSALPQHNGNLLCAVDLETTGSDPHQHEICQIGFQPLNIHYEPLEGVRPFYMNVRPLKPETSQAAAQRVHGLKMEDLLTYGVHPDLVYEKFEKWFQSLNLAHDRRLIMLAHNCQFEMKFLQPFFGTEFLERVFNFCTRDSMYAAIYINDHAVRQGTKPPFGKVNLTWLCEYFGITNTNPHDALSDAIAGAAVYKKLIEMDVIA